MSEDPWNISPSDKERIQKRIKENSEKTFFRKYGGSLKSFIGLILFAFVVVSLRTENGRCTILPFIFSEQCNVPKEINFNCSDVFDATVDKDRKSLTIEINGIRYFLYSNMSVDGDIIFTDEKRTFVFNESEKSLYQSILLDTYYCDKK